LQDVANYMVKASAKDIALADNSYIYRKCPKGNNVITDKARISFNNAFGITPSKQIIIENAFKNYTWPTKIIEADTSKHGSSMLLML
jgi:hypothetical protein